LALALGALSLRLNPGMTERISIEAESYAAIAAPMEIVQGVAGASEGSSARIPMGSGQGWRGQGSGSITYRFETREPGRYVVWARTLWGDGCTNAFFLTANDGARLVLGNDAVFGQWHWVHSPALPLKGGINLITFANHSDGTALDKVIVTNDRVYQPEGLGEGMTRFFDGFAGCDADNTGSWTFVRGKWKVIGEGQNDTDGCLAEVDPGGGLAVAGYAAWHDYDAGVKVRFSSRGAAGLIVFRNANADQLALSVNVEGDSAAIVLIHERAGSKRVLGRGDIASFRFDDWYDIAIRQSDEGVVCLLDGDAVVSASYSGGRRGEVGLFVAETGGVYFDNVDVRFRKN
jgi:hypothetical protein